MAVYYKFKSARDYDSIAMDGPFISVGVLKEKIFESKHLGRGTDFDLVVTNAQTNEEYLDEGMLIPKNTSVLIRRVPGRPRMPIVTEQEPKVENKVEETPLEKSSFSAPDSSAMKYTEDNEWDEFGNDLYAIPEVTPVQPSNVLPDAPPTNKADEDSKIKALIDTPALDWQRQGTDGFGPGRGFGRGMAGRMGGRGFGLERKTPPQGYVCHRCKVPGHFIQHCPTNGDPNFDIKRVKPPTGIPKSMLMATPDGSYALPSGAVAVLKPNEAAFEKEIEGLPSTRSVGDLPPELHCPLCKEVMKNAVLTSKCCFTSFCDKCIRDYIISKAKCVCGATNILADDLLPNKTLRDTINRILESGNSSAENAGSTFQVQDMESARNPQPKIPSPTQSAASKEEQKPSPAIEETPNPNLKEKVDEEKPVILLQQVPDKPRTYKAPDVSEATHESMSMREPASQGSAPLAEEEVQQRLAPGEAGKKKKKKKVRMPPNDMWKASQDLATESYMMPLGPSAYNPYWNGMQPGMESYMNPMNPFAAPMPFMGYGMGPLDMPFGGVMPPDPFSAQGYMMPVVPPQRDLADFGMGMNAGPPAMSREEFEARKADLRRRRENERRAEREFPRDREFGREVSSGVDISSMKSKPIPQPSRSGDPHPHHRHRSERSSPERPVRDLEPPAPPPPRPSKRKADHHDRDRDRDYDHHDDRERERERERHHRHHHQHHHRSDSSAKAAAAAETAPKPTSTAAMATLTAAERKHKASVFSRISFPEGGETKKRKVSSPSSSGEAAGGHQHKSSSTVYNNGTVKAASVSTSGGGGGRKSSSGAAAAVDYESSDDERHFKRKPSRYEPSPPPPADWEDEIKHSRSSRDRKHR
ncbi:E3 ubiquitin ligase PQT3-like isoform X2 [Ricinus communis]|uniref:Retinoblastoma-binding protein, putative n=1 Tax=Ricinus communis TaxID=3988 RepID=B9SXE4_RICCO|nr:E3 ubiquitin ligase PQT3-like isoform X2 [Ricinus communis]EEF31732.1 retinoblastoma-binding protein, putative [Ricinus communis]|eukprot:XP_002530663.1 E3 ubiquitin ligase PQT3-like isoform X2 [Ricinus communis]